MEFFKEFFGSTSYREAQAWVFVVVNAIVLTIYGSEGLGNGGFLSGEGLSALAGIVIALVCTTFFTILLIVPTAIIFNRTANEKADERDKQIHTQGAAAAFWTIFALASLCLVAYVLHSSGDLLFHSIMMSILVAQIVFALVVAVKYRRSGAPLFLGSQD